MTTNTDLDQAREWAKDNQNPKVYDPQIRPVARVIASLPDEWIDADKLREVIEKFTAWEPSTAPQNVETANARLSTLMEVVVDNLEALLPDPEPRTLADMPREKRKACQWMQADFDDEVIGAPIQVVITKIYPTVADIVLPQGNASCVRHEKLTPRPDLRRMAWPEEQATEKATVPTRPEDVPEGEAWIVMLRGYEWVGTRESNDEVWALARMDGGSCRYAYDRDLTLVSRLVPEVTE